MSGSDDVARRVEQVVRTVLDAVFDDVRTLRTVLATGGPLTPSRIDALAPLLADLLRRPEQLAVGAGVILEPDLLPYQPLRLEWWQLLDGNLVPLNADLNRECLGFYDYAGADWFSVPRRTGRPHVLGPYVDVHGTQHYTLTLTLPVQVGDTFVGVAGADVPLQRFEARVLSLVAPADDFVLTNAEHRVVLSTSAGTPPGSLFPPSERSRALDPLGWGVHLPPFADECPARTGDTDPY